MSSELVYLHVKYEAPTQGFDARHLIDGLPNASWPRKGRRERFPFPNKPGKEGKSFPLKSKSFSCDLAAELFAYDLVKKSTFGEIFFFALWGGL